MNMHNEIFTSGMDGIHIVVTGGIGEGKEGDKENVCAMIQGLCGKGKNDDTCFLSLKTMPSSPFG